MDKYREQLLNYKLKKQYDSIIKSCEGRFSEKELKSFKVKIRVKLNAAYRYGVYSSGGKNTL